MHGHERCRNETNGHPTAVRSKAISGVTGHVLHSFCAGDHYFKGIVGTLLINQMFFCLLFIHIILFHGTLMKTTLFFFFLQIHFHTAPIKLRHQRWKVKKNKQTQTEKTTGFTIWREVR